jgi:hypothetical protein
MNKINKGQAMKKIYKRSWRPFEEARQLARSLRLNSSLEWRAWVRSEARPDGIPIYPEGSYRGKGWAGFKDWLGKDLQGRNIKYRPFLEARSFVRSLGFKNIPEWNAWAKSSARPQDIPTEPRRTYLDSGWVCWGDWLGTGRIFGGKYPRRPFKEAREFVRSLGLKNSVDWREWARSGARPKDIAYHPETVYKGKGWVSMKDWLGTERSLTGNS